MQTPKFKKFVSFDAMEVNSPDCPYQETDADYYRIEEVDEAFEAFERFVQDFDACMEHLSHGCESCGAVSSVWHSYNRERVKNLEEENRILRIRLKESSYHVRNLENIVSMQVPLEDDVIRRALGHD